MWAKQLKDKKVRFFFNKKEFRNLPFEFLVNNCSLDSIYRFHLNKKSLSLNKKFFKTQIKNRCVLSLRSRSPISAFRLSRVIFRVLASNGSLTGVKKSSW